MMALKLKIYTPPEYALRIKDTLLPISKVSSLKEAKRFARNILIEKPELDFIEIMENNESVYFYAKRGRRIVKLVAE